MEYKALVALSCAVLAMSAACGDAQQPKPALTFDIEATVEARIQEERVAEATAEARIQAAAKVMVEATAQAGLATTLVSPNPTSSATAVPPSPTATLVPPTATPTYTPTPTATPVPPTATPTYTPTPTATPVPPTATPIPPISTATPAIEETTPILLRKTYRHEMAGFSIDYPVNWEVMEWTEESTTIVEIAQPLDSLVRVEVEYVPNVALEDFVESRLSSEHNFREDSRVKVESLPGYLSEGVGSDGQTLINILMTTNDPWTISVMFESERGLEELNQPIFQAMIRSFQIVLPTHTLWATSTAIPTLTPTPTAAPPTPTPKPGSLTWKLQTGNWVDGAPVVVDDVVYLASQDGHLYAVGNEKGAKLWDLKVTDQNLMGDVLIVENMAYVSSTDHSLYAIGVDHLQPSALGVKWSFETGGILYRGPVGGHGMVYIGSVDGSVYALDAANGDLTWQYETGDKVVGSPQLTSDTLFVVSYDHYLYALDALNGQLRWKQELGLASITRPLITNGIVCVGSFDGRVYAFDAATGELVWNFWAGSPIWSSPEANEDTVFVGSDDGRLYALDTSTGNLKWSLETDDKIRSSPVAYAGKVYVGSYDDMVYAVNAQTGAVLWTYDVSGDIYAPVRVIEKTVFVGSRDNSLYAIVAGSSPGAEGSLSRTTVPVPSLEFVPLNQDEAASLLLEILDKPAEGVRQSTTVDGVRVSINLSFTADAVKLYETGYFLLTGERPPWIARVHTRDEYIERMRNQPEDKLYDSVAYCCERTAEGLELIVNGTRSSAEVIGSLAHEAGHARQLTLNPAHSKSSRDSNGGALCEAQAQSLQAAIIRKLGEYTGVNATILPYQYELREWVEDWTTNIRRNIDVLTEEHARGKALLWAAVLHDPELSLLGSELREQRILSPDSLLQLHNHLIQKSRADADDYVTGLLDNFLTESSFIRDMVLSRNGTVDDGFFNKTHTVFELP